MISREECEAYIDCVWGWLEGLGTGWRIGSFSIVQCRLGRARCPPEDAVWQDERLILQLPADSPCLPQSNCWLMAAALCAQASSAMMQTPGMTPAGRPNFSTPASSTAWRSAIASPACSRFPLTMTPCQIGRTPFQFDIASGGSDAELSLDT